MGGERRSRRRASSSAGGLLLFVLLLQVLQSTVPAIHAEDVTDKVAQVRPVEQIENDEDIVQSAQLNDKEEITAPLQLSERIENHEDVVQSAQQNGNEEIADKIQLSERLENDDDVTAEVQPEERTANDEVVAVSGDAEFEARKPRGLLAALFGYPDEYESIDPSSSFVVADASYSVNHQDGENGNSDGRRGTPAPQFKASQYAAVSKKTPSTIKAVTTVPPKATTSKGKLMSKKEEVNVTDLPLVNDGNTDAADNFTVTELTSPIVEIGNENKTELNVTIIKAVDEEDGDNSTRTERSSGNKREAVPSMGNSLQPQPLPAGYILWHPVPASFLGGPNIPNNGELGGTRESNNNGPLALASEGAPMFMGPPHGGGGEGGGPPFHPHRPFFVERNFGGNAFGNNVPFPITQFSTPNIFAVSPTGGPLPNHNEPHEEEDKDNKRNRNRGRKERNRKKKGGKKNRPKNNNEDQQQQQQQQNEAQRDKRPEEGFQRAPLHLMLPPLPPNGFPNSPFMHPHNQPPQMEHNNQGPDPSRPPPPPFNRDFPPPMHQNGPPHPQFQQGRHMENVPFRNGNNERGPPPHPNNNERGPPPHPNNNERGPPPHPNNNERGPPPHPNNNMPFNNNDQFHPRPSPSPSAHPVKFEIDQQEQRFQEQREREQQFHERPRFPPQHHPFQPPNPQQLHDLPPPGPPPPTFQPPPPMHQQNHLSAPNLQNGGGGGGFHPSSPPPQNIDVLPVRAPPSPRPPPPNFQQFPETKPAARPMASQSQQQPQAASESPAFVTASHNSHPQSLPDVPPIHFGSSPSPISPFRNFGGPDSFARPPPFHPPPTPNLGLDRSHFGIPSQNKDDSLIYTRDFPKILSDPNLVLSTSSPSLTSNHLMNTDSPISRITTTSPPPSTFGLPRIPGPTSPRPINMPKPFGLFSSTPHPHQLSPAASHRLPQTHPNLPDYRPMSSTIRASTVNSPNHNDRAETTTGKSSVQANQDSYPSPGFHTGHKGYPSSVTAPNYVTSSEVPFHTTVAPPPRVSAITKSHYFQTSTSNYGTSLRPRHRGNPRGSLSQTNPSSSDPTYEIQYQSPVPVTTTYSPIASRSSTSPPGVDVSPAYQQAQAQGGSYKPGTSRILLEMGQWSDNGKKDDLSQQK